MTSNPDPSIPLWVQIVLLILLIMINGYLSLTESALASANKNKLKSMADEGNKKAERVLALLDEPRKFNGAVQVGMTFIGFLACTSAAIGLSGYVERFLNKYDITASYYLAILIVVIIFSYVMFVLGVVFPRKIAMQHSEKIATATIGGMYIISLINRPFTFISVKTVKLFLLITRQKVDMEDEEFSEEEVMSMLESGQESGALKEEGKKMINSIFAFDDKLAYEVMTPRTDVFSIDINDPAEEYIDELMELRYSRIPVYDDDSDNIIGILYIKDYLIKAREDGFDNVDIKSILREPYLVPETKNIDALFFELQKTKQHIAILIDEYGGFSGIVTMEDIIEEVMGDIDDEYDEEEPEIEKIDDCTFRVSGFMDLDDINEKLDIDLQSEKSETLGGFIIDLLGEIPGEDESDDRVVEYENYTFKIESVKDRRIEMVKLHISPVVEENEGDKEEDPTETNQSNTDKNFTD